MPAPKTPLDRLLAYGVAARSNSPAGTPTGEDAAKAATAGLTTGVPVAAVLATLGYLLRHAPEAQSWLVKQGIAPDALKYVVGAMALAGVVSGFLTKYAGLVASGPRIVVDPADPARPEPIVARVRLVEPIRETDPPESPL